MDMIKEVTGPILAGINWLTEDLKILQMSYQKLVVMQDKL